MKSTLVAMRCNMQYTGQVGHCVLQWLVAAAKPQEVLHATQNPSGAYGTPIAELSGPIAKYIASTAELARDGAPPNE